MKILVTGAAGFMGSHLFDCLIEHGHDVCGIDNYSIGTYCHSNISRIDLFAECERLDKFIREFRPDVVYHLAAWAHEGLSQFCPIKITQNNYDAHLNVLVSSIRYKVKRIVVASSMSVYGDQDPPFTEDMQRNPVDVYAISKAAMEKSTEILSKVHGIEYVIVRPHNVYGPRQVMHDPYRNVVGIFINRMLAGKNFYIYGDGEQKRSFSYIDDVTPYIAKCGWLPVNGEIINIGPIEEFTINQLAKEVMSNFKHAPQPEYLPDRPLEVKYAWCDNEKAKRLLGYTTSISFADGVARMIQWAQAVGYQEPVYLQNLELISDNTPETWVKKLI